MEKFKELANKLGFDCETNSEGEFECLLRDSNEFSKVYQELSNNSELEPVQSQDFLNGDGGNFVWEADNGLFISLEGDFEYDLYRVLI